MRRITLLTVLTLMAVSSANAQFVAPGASIPVVANLPGLNATDWRTDVSVVNLSDNETSIRLLLLPEIRNGVPVFEPEITDPIIIASRSGAGIYPDGAQIYKEGIYGGPETAPGWNPNDEHALLLPISGTTRAFAVRDDNPWNVS